MNTPEPIQDEPGKLIKGHAGISPNDPQRINEIAKERGLEMIRLRAELSGYKQIILQRDAEILRLKGELAEAQKGWVSVKERLPKAMGYYETRTIQFFSLATRGFSRPAHEEETHWRAFQTLKTICLLTGQ